MNDDLAIILVDHGSKRAGANEILHEVAALISARSQGRLVYAAHMELADPSIEHAFGQAVSDGASRIIVHPYMLTPGKHAAHDIPLLAQKAARLHPGIFFCVTEPLGVHLKIAEVILERCGLSHS